MSNFDGATSDLCLRKIDATTSTSCESDNQALSEITDLTSTLRLGADGYNGYIAEVIIYRRHLKDSEKAKVQKYLWNKYSWTLPMDFETETSIINFENDKLQSLKFDMNLERLSKDVIGHKIPLDKPIKFPVSVNSTLSLLADDTEEGSLATLLANEEHYDLNAQFRRPIGDVNIYTSTFANDENGWEVQGGTLSPIDWDTPNTPNEPDDYLQCNCTATTDYHEIFMDLTSSSSMTKHIEVGEKYRLTGDMWLQTVPNLKSLVLRVGGNEVFVLDTLSQSWQSFSIDFEAETSTQYVQVRARDENDNEIFLAETSDVFYIQDFKLTHLDAKQEIVNIKIKKAKINNVAHSQELGGNKKIDLSLSTFIDASDQDIGLGISGVYTASSA